MSSWCRLSFPGDSHYLFKIKSIFNNIIINYHWFILFHTVLGFFGLELLGFRRYIWRLQNFIGLPSESQELLSTSQIRAQSRQRCGKLQGYENSWGWDIKFKALQSASSNHIYLIISNLIIYSNHWRIRFQQTNTQKHSPFSPWAKMRKKTYYAHVTTGEGRYYTWFFSTPPSSCTWVTMSLSAARNCTHFAPRGSLCETTLVSGA